MAKNNKQQIKGDILISELMDLYPDAADYLVENYDFYCIGCLMADFETLEEGAYRHGIENKDFEKLLKEINKFV